MSTRLHYVPIWSGIMGVGRVALCTMLYTAVDDPMLVNSRGVMGMRIHAPCVIRWGCTPQGYVRAFQKG